VHSLAVITESSDTMDREEDFGSGRFNPADGTGTGTAIVGCCAKLNPADGTGTGTGTAIVGCCSKLGALIMMEGDTSLLLELV